MSTDGIKIIAKNKKAYFNYSVEDEFECGVVLRGTEVKSVREGKISFPDSFAEIIDDEVWLKNMNISENIYSSFFNHEPMRHKKLLLHKEEIKRLKRKVQERGYTLVPLLFYLKNGRLKIKLGLCRGKKNYDKRADIKERDVKRDVQRELRDQGR